MFKIFICSFLLLLNLNASETLKVGVLAFGTVNWELDVLKHNKLDEKNGFNLEFVKLASKSAQNIALQAGSVDIIVNDFLWVNTQRANNKDFTFYPYSKATGTLYISEDLKAKDFLDLQGMPLGIAGGVYDKTWLILRAYSKNKFNKDLKDIVNLVYAGAPILYKKMLDKSLSASINFWHFNSKLQAKGFKPLVEMSEVLQSLKIEDDVSFVGWVFSENKASKNRALYNSFIKATKEAKDILLTNNTQWERIKPLMNIEDENSFESLKEGYKKGVIKEFTQKNFEASEKIFDLLLNEGGENLVGNSKYLQKATFWKYEDNNVGQK